MELSLFFPAFNEEDNIKKSVKQALSVLPKIADKFEIIIVNDGSTDKTLKIAKQLERQYEQVRVVSQQNKGYGGALKLGFEMAKYEWIFFTDADLQFNLKEIKKLTKFCSKSQLIIGYRKNRAEGWKRQFLALALKYWNWLLLSFPLSIRDADCAFKLIKRQVIEEISPLMCDGAMISTELLLKAKMTGFEMVQVPVSHYPRKYGNPTGNNLSVIIRAIRETIALQKLLLFGHQAAIYETSWQ